MAHNNFTDSSGLFGLLSDFLLHWEPSSSRFIPSIRELATYMSDGRKVTALKDIWGNDNSLLNAWLNDLIKVSYIYGLKYPHIVDFLLFVFGYFR